MGRQLAVDLGRVGRNRLCRRLGRRKFIQWFAFDEGDLRVVKLLAGGSELRANSPQQAQTIDALFAPLPPVESRGRAWLFANRELKPVALRLGISDGTYTELMSEELQENMEVVTGVTGLAPTRTVPQGGGSGNPLMPGRGGPGGGRGPGR